MHIIYNYKRKERGEQIKNFRKGSEEKRTEQICIRKTKGPFHKRENKIELFQTGVILIRGIFMSISHVESNESGDLSPEFFH